MNHYLSFDVSDQEDNDFLIAQLVRGVHSFLVYELGEQAQQQNRIALAFPQATTKGYITPHHVRIFGEDADLKKLLRYPPMLRYSSALDCQISPVPDCEQWSLYKRFRQIDRQSPATIRRERTRAKGRGEKFVIPKRPSSETMPTFLTINLHSHSTGQAFPIRVQVVKNVGKKEGLFNAYGLSLGEASVADF